jgi:hypothetical protein
MSAGTVVLDPKSESTVQARTRRGWIHSPGLDLPLLILSPLAGLVVILLSRNISSNTYAATAALFLLAVPHYLSTFSFYLGDADRAYYRSRKLAFWVGPFLIVAAVIGMRLTGLHTPLVAVIFLWNIYHVAMQSGGILSVYRRLNGGPDSEARVTRLGILFVNGAVAFWHIERMPSLFDLLIGVHPALPALVRWTLLVGAILYGGRMVLTLAGRTARISGPEILFLSSSLLLFHPYLWVRNYDLATLGTLVGHFVQYLVVVWLIHRRRYKPAEGSRLQRSLSWVSGRVPVLLLVLAASGTLIYGVDKITRNSPGHLGYVILLNSLALTHFYLDGLIWSFRRSYVRSSIGPYLTPEAQRVIRNQELT